MSDQHVKDPLGDVCQCGAPWPHWFDLVKPETCPTCGLPNPFKGMHCPDPFHTQDPEDFR